MDEQRRAKTLTWGRRILIVLLVMFGLAYLFLSLAERMKDPARLGIQDYLTQSFGQPAQITDLELFELVPNFLFRFRGIDIRDNADPERVLLHADKVFIAMPAWRAYLGMRDYLGFEIEGLQLATGFVTPKMADIRFAGISDPDPENARPQLLVDGSYNGLPLLVTAEIERSRAGRNYLYSLYKAFPITFKLGGMEATGIYERGFNTTTLKQVQLVRGQDRAEFVLRDIRRDPASGTAEGTINGESFTALVDDQDGTTVFTITPSDASPDNLRMMTAFVDGIRGDLGLEEGSDFAIRLTEPGDDGETNQTETDTP